jgi:hypothetical protein
MTCRRASNELAASIQIEQLRLLQAQLGNLIQKKDSIHGLDLSTHSSVSSSSGTVCSLERMSRDTSEISPLTKDVHYDLESGTSIMPTSYEQQSTKVDDDTMHDTHGHTFYPEAFTESTDTLPITHCRVRVSFDDADSMISSDSTDPTKSTCGSFRKSKPRRKYSLQAARSWRSRQKRARSSILGTKNKDGPSIDDSECKSLRQLPTYDFLQKDDEEKEGGSLLPGTQWWHSVFLLSVISMAACIITLWTPYPMGARMPTKIVATMPWSNGCQGLQSCICPRETICADDLLSMIFLTIARSTAWANYPLYMMMFMSKANNLNNFLQTTALRCWVNFSDYHRVHTLFGIVICFESTSHTFFHILRWARRNNDIQVSVTRYFHQCRSKYRSILRCHSLPIAVVDKQNRYHRFTRNHCHSLHRLTNDDAVSQETYIF